MCSIFGCFAVQTDNDKIKECFSRTASRGPDDSELKKLGGSYLGFHRLSIMGLDKSGMQPFSYNGKYIVCNGEIYGFKKVKEILKREGYVFNSDSDCEILLPLYEMYGEKMFAMLDSEFALIICDENGNLITAARDPIGIRPLYYGLSYDGLVFASEPKNLVGLCNEIKPFPPGHYYKDGKFVCYNDIAAVKEICNDDLETACAKIRQKLISGVKKRLVSDAPVGFLLSGGLDSSLVCSIAAKCSVKPIRTFAVGMNNDAIDLKYARKVAEYIGSVHTEVIITEKDVISALPQVVKILGTYDITTIRASIGMYLICKYIHEHTEIRVLLTGEVSDEIFGYKYTDFAPSAEAFQLEAEKRVRELHMYDVLRADRCISVNAIEARVPFGDLDFISYVMSLNPEMKLNKYGIGKYLLRHAFEKGYLPNDILMREKAAFSDAVGHSMVDDLKKFAENKYSDEEFEQRKKLYSFATPFTKESLLYRDLFETYYSGQAAMVSDFWMPNKTWKGCNVNDPSARVLSNYGSSGF